jgi:hypothetical protein
MKNIIKIDTKKMIKINFKIKRKIKQNNLVLIIKINQINQKIMKNKILIKINKIMRIKNKKIKIKRINIKKMKI